MNGGINDMTRYHRGGQMSRNSSVATNQTTNHAPPKGQNDAINATVKFATQKDGRDEERPRQNKTKAASKLGSTLKAALRLLDSI